MITALDDENNVFLAAYAEGEVQEGVLSVESTAIALALMTHGRRGDGWSDLSTQIETATSFKTLVALVRDALAEGEAPISQVPVVQAIFSVLGEVEIRRNGQALRAAPSRKVSMNLARPSVRPELPHTLLGSGPDDIFYIDLIGTDGDRGVKVVGRFPINIAVRGLSLSDDSPIQPLESLNGAYQVIVPAASIGLRATSDPVIVPGDGDAWNIQVLRSDRTWMLDMVSLVEDVLFGVFSGAVSDACISAVAYQQVAEPWTSFETSEDAMQVAATVFRRVFGPSNISGMLAALAQCSGQAVGFNPTDVNSYVRLASAGSKFLLAIGNAVRRIEVVNSGLTIGARITYMVLFWNYEEKLGVCLSRINESTAPTIVACPSNIAPTRSSFSLQLGQVQPLGLIAFDESGDAIDVPQPIEYSSSRPDLVRVDSNGVLTAKAISDEAVVINAVYWPLGLVATSTVQVVAAPQPSVSIAASASSVRLGAPVTLTWESSNASSCMASGSWSGQLPLAGSSQFVPEVAGIYEFRIQCAEGAQSHIAKATVLAIDELPTNTLDLLPSSRTSLK